MKKNTRNNTLLHKLHDHQFLSSLVKVDNQMKTGGHNTSRPHIHINPCPNIKLLAIEVLRDLFHGCKENGS